jgi:hypothetical protein
MGGWDAEITRQHATQSTSENGIGKVNANPIHGEENDSSYFYSITRGAIITWISQLDVNVLCCIPL